VLLGWCVFVLVRESLCCLCVVVGVFLFVFFLFFVLVLLMFVLLIVDWLYCVLGGEGVGEKGGEL